MQFRKSALRCLLAILLIIITSGIARAGRTFMVYGLDVSGSYKLGDRAVKAGTLLMSKLGPGSVLHFRLIHSSSFADHAHVLRVEIPAAVAKPQSRMDYKALLAYRRATNSIRTAKLSAIDQLRTLKPPDNKLRQHTDLLGFFAAASDVFQTEAQPGDRKLIIVSSDFQGNVHHKVTPYLEGVSIIALAFESKGDPSKAIKLKNHWHKFLVEKCRAKSLKFLPPSVGLRF